MKSIAGILLSSCILLNINLLSFSQENSPVQLGLSYIGDRVNNFKGGIKKGACYLDMISLTISADTKNAGLWEGGNLFVRGSKTSGATPSQQLIGDMQVSSNIEAGNHLYLQEFWFSQIVGKFELIAGLQDMNANFANTQNGALFLNSSFGIHPTISANFPAPVFPLTSFGFTSKFNLSDKLILKAAVYDGNPTGFEKNPYNLRWKMNMRKDYLLVSEIESRISLGKDFNGTYKAGYIQHKQFNQTDSTVGKRELRSGFYLAADQQVWHKSHHPGGLGIFAQYSFNPGHTECFYTGVGVNYTGLFSKKGTDIAGIAIAHIGYERTPVHETTLEFTYKLTMRQKLFVQPDFQYIINPSGYMTRLSNCLEGILRVGFNF